MDYSTAFLAGFLLLVLSLLTIEFCRRDRVSFTTDDGTYLFRGKTVLHALASNVGATFSITYFFGAVIVFSKLLGTWAVLAIGLGCSGAFLLYRRLLRHVDVELKPHELAEQRTNVLLALLRQKMAGSSFRSLASLYGVIYLGLLVEELAVSRALLASMFPARPILGGLLLSVLCLVVLVYLYVGGFRAVLISDLVQIIVLSAFTAMLTYLSLVGSAEPELLSFDLDISPSLAAANIFCVALLGVAWFVAGIDFSSRLNFDGPRISKLVAARSRLMRHSFVAIGLTLSVGVLFAQASDYQLPPGMRPSEYLTALTSVFLGHPVRIMKITFLISIFCMMFTTIDTLLLAVMQASHFTKGRLARRDTLPALILVAALFSMPLPIDSLYAFGILTASWITLPLLPILRALFPKLRWAPEQPLYAWAALIVSGICFAYFHESIVARQEVQFLIPGGVVFLATSFLAVQTGWEKRTRRGGR